MTFSNHLDTRPHTEREEGGWEGEREEEGEWEREGNEREGEGERGRGEGGRERERGDERRQTSAVCVNGRCFCRTVLNSTAYTYVKTM